MEMRSQAENVLTFTYRLAYILWYDHNNNVLAGKVCF